MVKKDKDNPANFGAPVVAPGVGIDPVAAKYLQRSPTVQAQQGRSAPPIRRPPPDQHATPVAGGPGPRIPPLTGAPTQAGLTMSDYAVRRGDPTPIVVPGVDMTPPPGAMGIPAPAARPFFAADPPPQAAPVQAPPQMAAPMSRGILQTDLLPERAKQDPMFQQGMGSEFAVNQPALAMKYGVIRSGNHVPPQQLSTGRPGLSPQTVEGLGAVTRSMEEDHLREQGPPPARPNVGGTSMDADAKEKKDGLEALDDFDWMRLRAVMGDMLGNEEQRVIVEERLEPLDIEEHIMLGYSTQEVPIIVHPQTGAKRFFPTFRSTNGQINNGLKLALVLEAQALKLRGAYLDDKFAMMGACASTLKINGLPLPEMLDKDGNFNEEMFWAKFNKFIKFSVHTISSLGIHAFWFDMRVRALHVTERVKNG